MEIVLFQISPFKMYHSAILLSLLRLFVQEYDSGTQPVLRHSKNFETTRSFVNIHHYDPSSELENEYNQNKPSLRRPPSGGSWVYRPPHLREEIQVTDDHCRKVGWICDPEANLHGLTNCGNCEFGAFCSDNKICVQCDDQTNCRGCGISERQNLGRFFHRRLSQEAETNTQRKTERRNRFLRQEINIPDDHSKMVGDTCDPEENRHGLPHCGNCAFGLFCSDDKKCVQCDDQDHCSGCGISERPPEDLIVNYRHNFDNINNYEYHRNAQPQSPSGAFWKPGHLREETQLTDDHSKMAGETCDPAANLHGLPHCGNCAFGHFCSDNDKKCVQCDDQDHCSGCGISERPAEDE